MAAILARISHRIAECMTKRIFYSGNYRFFVEISRAQTVPGAPSLVFLSSAGTCSLKRSPCYAFDHEHPLKPKILRDHRAPR